MIKTNKNAALKTMMLGLMVVMLGACSEDFLYEPTFQTTNKIQVKEETHQQIYDVAAIDDKVIADIQHRYSLHGEGTVDVVISYDPGSSYNTAVRAADEAAKMAALLQKKNIRVKTGIMPIAGKNSQALVSYTSYTAHAPEGCTSLNEMQDDNTRKFRDYKQGCTMNDFMARQIARPKDLLGRDDIAPADARRNANIVDGYRNSDDVSLQGASTE